MQSDNSNREIQTNGHLMLIIISDIVVFSNSNNNSMSGTRNSNTMSDVSNIISNTMSNTIPIQLNPSTTRTCKQCREGRMVLIVGDVLTLLLMMLIQCLPVMCWYSKYCCC